MNTEQADKVLEPYDRNVTGAACQEAFYSWWEHDGPIYTRHVVYGTRAGIGALRKLLGATSTATEGVQPTLRDWQYRLIVWWAKRRLWPLTGHQHWIDGDFIFTQRSTLLISPDKSCTWEALK